MWLEAGTHSRKHTILPARGINEIAGIQASRITPPVSAFAQRARWSAAPFR